MKWKVLVSAPYMQPVLDRFEGVFAENEIEVVAPPVTERLSEEELLGIIEDIDGVICGDDAFTERVLEKGAKLVVLSKWGTGIDSIDQDAAKRLGIAVRNTPNAFSEPVADSVYAYMLCFARRTPWMDRAMHAGSWKKIPGVALRECTLGVIGVGNVGKAVVRRARGFGMRVVGTDPKPMPAAFLEETGIEMVSLDDLLETSDFVSMNCDLNSTSVHLLGERALSLMKNTAYVINTARGPVVDEAALVAALESGGIAGAGLDVFEVEPLPADSPMNRMDNVLLAPHNSNSSPEAWEAVHHNTINNLLEELRGASR